MKAENKQQLVNMEVSCVLLFSRWLWAGRDRSSSHKRSRTLKLLRASFALTNSWDTSRLLKRVSSLELEVRWGLCVRRNVSLCPHSQWLHLFTLISYWIRSDSFLSSSHISKNWETNQKKNTLMFGDSILKQWCGGVEHVQMFTASVQLQLGQQEQCAADVSTPVTGFMTWLKNRRRLSTRLGLWHQRLVTSLLTQKLLRFKCVLFKKCHKATCFPSFPESNNFNTLYFQQVDTFPKSPLCLKHVTTSAQVKEPEEHG